MMQNPKTCLNPENADRRGRVFTGGRVDREWIATAYSRGIFPWDMSDEGPVWYCPKFRNVLHPMGMRINRTLKKFLRKCDWRFTMNVSKEEVIRECAAPRPYADDTWIAQDFIDTYPKMDNYVSIEVREQDGTLIGGLYGLAVGGVFCGESQFSRKSNASKAATFALCCLCLESGIGMIDCQLYNDYLESLGCFEIARSEYLNYLEENLPYGRDEEFFAPKEFTLIDVDSYLAMQSEYFSRTDA